MTIDEIVEHIDAPLRAYLEDAAKQDDQPSQTAWEQHQQWLEKSEEEESLDCESDPEVTLDIETQEQCLDEGSDQGGSSPELLSPPQVTTQPLNQDMWTAIQAMIQQSNSRIEVMEQRTIATLERMEAMEQRSIDRFERLETRVVTALSETRESTDERFQTVQQELRNIKGELNQVINTRIEEVRTKLEGSVANAQSDLMTAQEDLQVKMKQRILRSLLMKRGTNTN
jgi:hypothetical protein